MTDALVLGTTPGALTVYMTLGDPWESSLVLKEDGVPVAWPAAPVLEFAIEIDDELFDLPATLSADPDTDTDDAMATWTLTEEQVGQLASGPRVRLAVSGVTYWKGKVRCQS